jgi:hypothetical protein
MKIKDGQIVLAEHEKDSPDVIGYDDNTVEAIAIMCHEANRTYCNVVMNDQSQKEWSDAPMWQRDSARTGVRAHLATPGGLDPRAAHESWLAQKVAEGWVYGPVKDAEKKQHPCCVAYDELPPDQQRKDKLFGAIVEAMR